MRCCNIKWASNKHWFNINQILYLINVETTSNIILTLIHNKSIQHFIYIIPYKLYKIYPGGCARCVPSVRKTISNFFIFSFFFLSLPPLFALHCASFCTGSFLFTLLFLQLTQFTFCVAQFTTLRLFYDESVELIASLYLDETERVLLLVFCVIVVVSSNGGSAYLSSFEDGEVGGFASPCVGAAS